MSLRFCVLGSGSSGNASYLEADGFGVLLDIGLGPRRLARGLTVSRSRMHRARLLRDSPSRRTRPVTEVTGPQDIYSAV